MSQEIGSVVWINGPVVRTRGSRQVGMLEVVEVGEQHLVGEVIGLEGEIATVQVYYFTRYGNSHAFASYTYSLSCSVFQCSTSTAARCTPYANGVYHTP